MAFPLLNDLPRLGRAGSRSAELHSADDAASSPSLVDEKAASWFTFLRILGTVGALIIGVSALGSGALPVVDNPYNSAPLGSFMARMLHTSSALTLYGVGLVVTAWTAMGAYVSAPTIRTRDLIRTAVAWSLPILLTAPLFTQDIYSYLAQGAMVSAGLDPYEEGPIAALGAGHPLARSVPFIWAQSPAPYGPVALSLSSIIATATNESIVWGVLAHRCVNLLGLIAIGWAAVRLARRCQVRPNTALWLSVLNPLTLLHLVGGIHNEAVLMGFAMVGMEVGLAGVSYLSSSPTRAVAFLTLGGVLISCAGLVKVTGFIGLGFLGMVLAREVASRREATFWRSVGAVCVAAGAMIAVLILTVAAVTALSGINLGWVTGQGGAATIRGWMSMTTDIGVIAGVIGSSLGLGDHTEAILSVTRTVGLICAAAWTVRMLFATFNGTIHPLGGLGVSTFGVVLLFPVVHPWYMLWALIPLASWANRPIFRATATGYSAIMSFFVLPRGLALPASSVLAIYGGAALAAIVTGAAWWWWMRFSALRGLS